MDRVIVLSVQTLYILIVLLKPPLFFVLFCSEPQFAHFQFSRHLFNCLIRKFLKHTSQQGRAGLNVLSKEEFSLFEKLNAEYKAKFGFVFILAVRNASKETILQSFKQRLKNSQVVEV